MAGPEPARILVADDEPAILELLHTALSLWGYAVELRPNGEVALGRALEGGIDILLVDHQMPLMTGLDLIRRLRAAGRTIPAILMSGYFSDALVRECRSVTGVRLLPKPFTIAELRDAIVRGIAPR